MESEEALKYYINEVTDSHNVIELAEEHILDEFEQATEFLQKVDLPHLTKLYQEGKEIPEKLVNDSISQRYLTQKQAETIKSRIRTLNKTLRGPQSHRKRQDIRDVTWIIETSNTGIRSRSATPDSLDSNLNRQNENFISDEDLLAATPSTTYPFAPSNHKTKIKWTSSEPIEKKKFSRERGGDVAHLGSENVVLKGYHPLNEFGTIPRRERSGSDPTTEIHLNSDSIGQKSPSLRSQVSRSHNSLHSTGNSESDLPSFEGLVRQNGNESEKKWEDNLCPDTIHVDELTDEEYRYLKPILYVELIAICDQYKISYLKRKASSKHKGKNVFGVNLSTLIIRDMHDSMVPEVFQVVIDQLNSRCINEEGILRLAGQKQKLQQLSDNIEDNFYANRRYVEDLIKQANVHELTGILKKLLRELPDPIFTMELYDMFYKTNLIHDPQDRMKALNLLVLLLPVQHRSTFQLVLKFLLNIISCERYNRMNLHNVAMISAPSFFPPRLLLQKNNINLNIKDLSKEELMNHINGAAVCCCIMETLLKVGENLWMVPGHLVHQAQQSLRKALQRKHVTKNKRAPSEKMKLARSTTQYDSSSNLTPRVKKTYFNS